MRSLSLILCLFASAAFGQTYPWTPAPLLGTFYYHNLPQNKLVLGTPAVTVDQGTVYWNGTTWQNTVVSTGLTPIPANSFLCNTTNGIALPGSCTTLPAANEPAHSGDVTNTAGSLVMTVIGIDGTSVPVNSAANQLLLTSAPGFATWASVPACLDSGGNHLNFNSATNTFSCGVTSASVGTNLYLSAYAGISCGGITDSRTGVVNAFAAAISAGQTVNVDCPVLIHTGLDYTKAVFINPGLKVNFLPGGYFVVDNVCTAAFVGENTHDVTWVDTQILYQGNFALLGGIDVNSAPCLNVPNHLNDVTIKNYLIAHAGNTFGSGGSSLWPGPTNRSAIFQFDGNSYRINFVGGNSRAYVADSATAGQFIPTIFS